MTDHQQHPEGWKLIPADQLRNNAFAVTARPFWPHVFLDWDGGRYLLAVFDEAPQHGEQLLSIELETLIVSEAEFAFDERRDGKVVPRLIRESNADLERKAAALEALAARLRQRHKRPEVVGGSEGGAANG